MHSLLIVAGDISPLDIISHLPLLSEEASVPYVFVASKEELGHASSTKRPTSCVLICPDMKKKKRKDGEQGKVTEEEEDYRELYDECFAEVKELVSPCTLLLPDTG
jgi:H/ACA ribonucleoprotein complex subunit 2